MGCNVPVTVHDEVQCSCYSAWWGALFLLQCMMGCSVPVTVHDEVQCPGCHKKQQMIEWDDEHQPSTVERNISTAMSTAYMSPLPKTP